MARTRTQTGKLPSKPLPVVDLDSDTMDVDDLTDLDNGNAFVDEPAMFEETKPERYIFETFTTFKSKHHLMDGLSLVRHLGGGKYELVNIQYVDTGVMGCEEVGEYLRSDPKRLRMFERANEDSQTLKLSIEQATNSAQFKIFRFLKLPIELRFRVYDFIIPAKGLLTWDKAGDKQESMFGVRSLNKQIYTETARHYYRNNFRIGNELTSKKPSKATAIFQATAPFLREITFEWWSSAVKDTLTFNAIRDCPQLKVLNLHLTKYCIHDGSGRSPNLTYQDDDSINKLSHTKSFDALMRIRGLEKVVVTRSETYSPSEQQILGGEIHRFEEVLNEELTRPREFVISPEKKKAKKRTTKRRTYVDNESSDDDFEVTKPRRRRRGN